jgi:hypothetical protein
MRTLRAFLKRTLLNSQKRKNSGGDHGGHGDKPHREPNAKLLLGILAGATLYYQFKKHYD